MVQKKSMEEEKKGKMPLKGEDEEDKKSKAAIHKTPIAKKPEVSSSRKTR